MQVPDPVENTGKIKRKATKKKLGKSAKKTKKNVEYDDSSEVESVSNFSLHDSNSSIGEEDFSALFDEDVCEQVNIETEVEQMIVYDSINVT